MSDRPKPKIGCSSLITKRWTCSSLFDVRKNDVRDLIKKSPYSVQWYIILILKPTICKWINDCFLLDWYQNLSIDQSIIVWLFAALPSRHRKTKVSAYFHQMMRVARVGDCVYGDDGDNGDVVHDFHSRCSWL